MADTKLKCIDPNSFKNLLLFTDHSTELFLQYHLADLSSNDFSSRVPSASEGSGKVMPLGTVKICKVKLVFVCMCVVCVNFTCVYVSVGMCFMCLSVCVKKRLKNSF